MSAIDYSGKRVIVTHNFWVGGPADAADTNSTIFIANRSYNVISASVIYSSAGGAGNVISVTRESGTESVAAGDLVASFPGDSDVDTVINDTSLTNSVLSAGDRLSFSQSGGGTCNGMCLILELVEI